MTEEGTPQGSARRLRLLVLASTYPRWAGDHEPGFVHLLSRSLCDRFEVTVLCPHAPGARRHETLDGIRVVRYRYAPARLETLVNDGGIITNLRQRWKWLLLPGFFLAQAWATWRQLRRLRPDVVHAHWLIPQGLVLALVSLFWRAAPPFVVTSHGADLYALRGRLMRSLQRLVARRAAAVTVVSSAMASELERLGVDPGKVSVQPMGVDLGSRFVPDPSQARSRDEILFVGRLVAKKGLRHLLDAMPAILAAEPGARLTVVGFGPELAPLQSQALGLGISEKISFVGAVGQQQLPALYRRAAVFVAPFVTAADGDQEGLGLVLVEAAGCGCPLVAGDVPAVRDVVVGPEVGRIVASGDTQALAAAVLATLREDSGTGTAAARRRDAVMAFDWPRRAKAYADLLARQAAGQVAVGAQKEPE